MPGGRALLISLKSAISWLSEMSASDSPTAVRITAQRQPLALPG